MTKVEIYEQLVPISESLISFLEALDSDIQEENANGSTEQATAEEVVE